MISSLASVPPLVALALGLGGVALAVFAIAARRGLFNDCESVKYQLFREEREDEVPWERPTTKSSQR